MAGTREERIAAAARAAGFPLVGCVPIEPLPVEPFLAAWLADGRAGEMTYLTRRTDVRVDPRRQFPWARSLVCVGFPYRPPAPPPVDWRTTLRGRIAAYTVGPDYHRHVQARLDRLGEVLAELFAGTRYLSYVDTGAIIEHIRSLKASTPSLTTTDCVKAVQDTFGITVHRRSLERALAGKKKLRKSP